MEYLSPKDLESRPLVVVGAGTLGRRIALMQATAGAEVRLVDPSRGALEEAQAYIESELPELVSATNKNPGTLTTTEDLTSALEGAWLITEAVPEKLEMKIDLFAELDRLAPSEAILASNSSSYPTRQMVERVSRRERVVNTHYYMPPKVNAVEIMSCGYTNPPVIDLLVQRLPAYGLVPFIVREESVGFIFNRVWAAIKRESLAVVAEGVSSPEDVDRLFSLVFGTSKGPFQLMDMVGLDVVLDVEEHYAKVRPELPSGPRQLLRRYVDQDRLGVKTGRGFYDYGTR
ncbi:MAG: 3-hydroxyacyl-CoA dehydrogenase family protein [Bryobacteraceae bacterium]